MKFLTKMSKVALLPFLLNSAQADECEIIKDYYQIKKAKEQKKNRTYSSNNNGYGYNYGSYRPEQAPPKPQMPAMNDIIKSVENSGCLYGKVLIVSSTYDGSLDSIVDHGTIVEIPNEQSRENGADEIVYNSITATADTSYIKHKSVKISNKACDYAELFNQLENNSAGLIVYQDYRGFAERYEVITRSPIQVFEVPLVKEVPYKCEIGRHPDN